MRLVACASAVASFPETALATEAAIRMGLLVGEAGYDLDATPRPKGADLAARRHGTTWATFHMDVDRARPLLLRIGATVWGGARQDMADDVLWDGPPGEALDRFVRERLAFACKRGRAEDPEHCAECPDLTHRRR